MEFTWAFFVLFILVIIPGFFIRKLYYYGEFSRQFGSQWPLVKIIFYLLITGTVNIILSIYLYHNLIQAMDLDVVINTYKDLQNSDKRISDNYDVLQHAHAHVMPFIGVLYTSALLLGVLSGRIIRITGLDLRFKLLRYKNTWFYLFNGYHYRMKNYDTEREQLSKEQKFQFSQADILIGSSPSDILYSGIVVDYELRDDNCQELKTVVLKHAKRYVFDGNEQKIQKSIPGNLFVLDCSQIKNINLTYIYGERKGSLESKIPKIIQIIFATIGILILPIFIFKMKWISIDIYDFIFEKPFYFRILPYMFSVQTLYMFNPYIEVKGGRYEYVTIKSILFRIVVLILLFSLIYWIF